MNNIKEWNSQKSEASSAAKKTNRLDEVKHTHNPCEGCGACHQMSRIHSMPDSPILNGTGDTSQGPNLQRACAANFFQRNFGNSYLQSISAGQGHTAGETQARTSGPTIQRKCSCGGSCSGCAGKEEEKDKIQAKLIVGPADDVYEQEADRVAEQIMRMPDPVATPNHQANVSVQRLTGGATTDVGSNISLDRSGGQSLSGSTREYMEPRFGMDFSHVRVHADSEAHQTAAQIRARAFTHGNHIWLGREESENDRTLMAHELTHVVQQQHIDSACMVYRKPSIAAWDYLNTGNTASDNCCRLCPSALGLDSSPASGYFNGIEMKAYIRDEEPGYSYDIKRWLHGKIWQRVSGAWSEIPGSAIGPNHMDDRHNDDECLTPQVSPPYLPYIYSIDSPGSGPRSNPTYNASANGFAQIGNFTEFVRIADSRGATTDDPKTFPWHVVVRAEVSGGRWIFDTANSEIEPGHRANLSP